MNSEESLPCDALRDVVGQMREMLDTGVNTMRATPPFASLKGRKKLYWELVEEKSVEEVLGDWN
jgi:hypothetical protein